MGVPRRTVIYAANADAPEEAMQEFYMVFKATLMDDSFGNAPITNRLFRFADGELIGAELVE